MKIQLVIVLTSILVSCGGGGTLPNKPAPKPVPPIVTSVSPLDGSSVVVSRSIFIYFDKPMASRSFTSESFKLVNKDNVLVAGVFEFLEKGVIFRPTPELNLIDTYTLTLTTDITDSDNVKLASSFTSSFTTVNGEWILNPIALVTPESLRSFYSRFSVANSGNYVAIQWADLNRSKSLSELYIKTYDQKWSAKTQIYTGTGLPYINYLRLLPNDLVSIFSENSPSQSSSQTATYTARSGITPEAFNRISVNDVVGFDQSLNGNAVVVFKDAGSFNVKSFVNGWSFTEVLIEYSGISRRGFPEDYVKPLIFDDGRMTLIYRRGNGSRYEVHARESILTDQARFTNPSIRLSARDIDLDYEQAFLVADNLVLYKYFDGTYYTIKRNALGWGTEKYVSTIPKTANAFKIVELANDQELILFTDGGTIQSTRYTAQGWQTATILNKEPNVSSFRIKQYYGIAGVDVNNESIAITWYSEKGIHSRQFVGTWQPENTILPYTDKSFYNWANAPKILITDSGQLHVFYVKNNTVFTAILK